MPPLPVLNPREVVRALERAGFVHVRQIGSHARMVRSGAYGTVAMHRQDIARHIEEYSQSSWDGDGRTARVAREVRRDVARFDVVLTPDLYDGGYTVTVPALPGCITDGRTVEEALENVKEAIDVYLDGSTEEELAVAGARFDVLIESVEVPKYVVWAASVSVAAD